MILTNVSGLYRDYPDPDSLIASITAAEVEEMLPSLDSGMIPKMEACLRAIRGGVPQAHIVDGRQPHAVLLEIFTDLGVGTAVNADGVDLTRRRMPLSKLRWHAVKVTP